MEDLNWSWQYWKAQEERWVQFECTDCLHLEYGYKAYQISENGNLYSEVKILQGTVDLKTLEMQPLKAPESTFKVKRTKDNVRCRPNGQVRHDPSIYGK